MTFENLHVALGGDGIARQAANAILRELGDQYATAEKLSTLRADDLLDMRNFGTVCLARVEAWLSREGMALQKSHARLKSGTKVMDLWCVAKVGDRRYDFRNAIPWDMWGDLPEDVREMERAQVRSALADYLKATLGTTVDPDSLTVTEGPFYV